MFGRVTHLHQHLRDILELRLQQKIRIQGNQMGGSASNPLQLSPLLPPRQIFHDVATIRSFHHRGHARDILHQKRAILPLEKYTHNSASRSHLRHHTSHLRPCCRLLHIHTRNFRAAETCTRRNDSVK